MVASSRTWRMIVGNVFPKTSSIVIAALLAAGCGHNSSPRIESANREWTANARGVVDQLRGDVVSVSGFDEVASARKGLQAARRGSKRTLDPLSVGRVGEQPVDFSGTAPTSPPISRRGRMPVHPETPAARES